MRLGKELSTGVIEESAGTGWIAVDPPDQGRADDSGPSEPGVEAGSPLSAPGPLVRSR
jgi:hypothetical protein